MLLISDGKTTGISGSFPLPYGLLSTIRFFERDRRVATAPGLIALELALAAFLLHLLATNPPVSALTAFSIGFPSLMIGLKFLIQKKVDMKRSAIKVIGVAPALVWVEHLLLCFTLALSALWANQMQGLPLMGASFFTLIVYLAGLVAAWPFLNFAYRHDRFAR
ncbi:MAG: hypothetical protein V4582_11700 [Pseudomonadota bacterium]